MATDLAGKVDLADQVDLADMAKMQELDVARFWRDDAEAHKDNCFNPQAKQVAFGVRMANECVFDELGIPGHPWEERPVEKMRQYIKDYNDKAEEVVGARLLDESYPGRYARFPYLKRVGEIFGSRYTMHDHVEWLEACMETPEELSKTLDAVERLDIADFVVPADWDAQCKRIYEETGVKPDPQALGGHAVRGPVTLATSIMGAENFLFLYYDEPELLARFSRVFADVLVKRVKAIDAACGCTEADRPHGFAFADDHSCLTTPEIYEAYAYPILRAVFDYCSPDEGDERFQHSDSAMAHIIPYLGRVRLNGCNFGPTVMVDDIRAHLPRARIDGCIAPLAFKRNDEAELFRQAKRDCDAALRYDREQGIRGLNLAMAGSISYGSSLKSMRLLMQVIQNYGRY